MTTFAANVDAAVVEALSSMRGYSHVGVMAPNPLPAEPFVVCYVVGGQIADHVVQTSQVHVEVYGGRESVDPVQVELKRLEGREVRGVAFDHVEVDVPTLYPDPDTSGYRWRFTAEVVVAAATIRP